MDRINKYRITIKQILDRHAQIKYSHGEIERLALCDEKQDHYLLLAVGWDGLRRIHSVIFHLRIHNNKVWVEADWTEQGVACELLEAGIPRDDIVLGFHSAEKRPYTEFAVT